MKITKRILALALVLMLTLSLSAPAFADGTYKITQDFIAEVGTIDGFTCTVGDIITDSDGASYEPVYLTYEGGDLSKYKSNITALFSENREDVQLYLYNLINFDKANLSDVLAKLNDINAQGTGVKLFADLSDNSVTAEMYMLTTPDSCLEIALTALGFMIGYTDSAFELLGDYAA